MMEKVKAQKISASSENKLGNIQSALAKSEDIFSLLVDAVEDYAIFALNPAGIILTWNRGGTRLKGYLPNEVIGTHFSRFYTQPDLDRCHPQYELEQATQCGKYEEEGWRIRKDGTCFWANVVITALRDRNGTLRGFGKVTRDLTKRKETEERLRQSEERFRLMIEDVEDYAMFMLTPDGKVATWNKGAERHKGYSAEEIIGKHFSIFYPKEDVELEKPRTELEWATQTGKYEDEGWRIRKNGTRFWGNVVITAMRDTSGKLIGFSKVTRDLTERKRAEDNLRRAYGQLEQRIDARTKELSVAKFKAEEAVKARDEFLSIASHELKTPLTSLKLQAQLRKRSVKKGDYSDFATDKLLELCEADERQVERLTFLVENMFDISKLTLGKYSLELEKIDLVSLTRNVAKSMEATLLETGNHYQLHGVSSAEGRWDRHRLEQVITNLLSNVGKYAPGSPVDISIFAEPSKITMVVRDQGKGIAKENHERIFNSFERAHDGLEVGGMGLGLYISRQICEAHHGSLTVESEPGAGCAFKVILPVDAGSPARNQL